MTLVPNGVDFEFFGQADKSFPEEYRDIPAPRIVYVGAIDTWFDYRDCFPTPPGNLPECHFVIIGLARTDISAIKGQKNIHILGPKPYERMPQFLSHAQVGMIPFMRNELVEFVNPIKLYEYMACGLPVVSTSWRELRAMNTPARLAEDAGEFVGQLRRALGKGSRSSEYVAYAKVNDWQSRIQQVLEVLE